jgi:nitrate reductase gamma subunit
MPAATRNAAAAFLAHDPEKWEPVFGKIMRKHKETKMRDLTNSIVFGWYPYLVLAVFLLGSWLRCGRERYRWQGGTIEWLRSRQLTWAAGLFLGGVLVLFVGHFVGLLTPISVFDTLGISHGFKQGMAIGIGGIAGVFGFIGIGLLVQRVLFDARIRTAASFAEIAILLMVFAQLTLGLATITVSLKYPDGCAMVKFMTWAQGILTFKPGGAALIAGVPLVFKLHLFLGMTILLVFPFTRAVSLWSVAWYLGRGYRGARHSEA